MPQAYPCQIRESTWCQSPVTHSYSIRKAASVVYPTCLLFNRLTCLHSCTTIFDTEFMSSFHRLSHLGYFKNMVLHYRTHTTMIRTVQYKSHPLLKQFFKFYRIKNIFHHTIYHHTDIIILAHSPNSTVWSIKNN